MPWIWDVFVVLMGLCVGSFLNVCIYRMPRGLSVAFPGSHCPRSKAPLLWWENIPVLSFVILGGKGRVSKAPISWQYPAVEIITAILFFVLWQLFTPAVAISYMIMASMMLAGSFIDWQFKIIPDSLTVGGAFVGLIAAASVPALLDIEGAWTISKSVEALGLSAQGMLLGSGVILWIALLAEMALKKEAMGFGDVKLLGFIGAFIGWKGAIASIFLGSFIGMAIVIVMAIAERISGKKEKLMGREIPFGPMLNAAAFAIVLAKGLALPLPWGI